MTSHLTKPIRAIHFMVLAFLMTLGTQGSAAETAKDCAKITDDAARLVCYDKFLGYIKGIDQSGLEQVIDPLSKALDDALGITSDTANANSNWRYHENQDAFTDANTSYLALKLKSGSDRGGDAPKTLILRCDGEGSSDIYMVVDGYIGSDAAKVRYRFEGKDAVSSSWDISTDGKAVFDTPWTKPGKFVLELASGNDFLFEVTDHRGVRSSAEFDNSLDPNFDYILSGCGS